MPYLLNVIYLLLIVICSPWLAYSAIRKGKYRDGWGEKLFGRVPRRTGDRPCIWLHAVSVGEVNLLQPILTELAAQKPTWEWTVGSISTFMLLCRLCKYEHREGSSYCRRTISDLKFVIRHLLYISRTNGC